MHIIRISYYLSAWVALSIGCKNKDQQQAAVQQGPVPVTTVKVVATSLPYYDEYPAVLVPLNQSELRTQITGYVTGIYFKDGSKVTKGQRLYSIDQQIYQANYQQAQANIAVQETNMDKAQKDADRYHELDKQDAIAKQQVDYADAALMAAKKQVAAAKASANAVKASVNFATIYAPFTGTIGISQVRQGTSVVAGQTILNTISTDNPMSVDFAIDQKEFYKFSKLQQAKNLVDSTFSLAFGTDVYPQYGHLQTIDRAVDPQTGAIKIRLSFSNERSLLKAGMSATVRVLNASSSGAVIIPYKAIVEQLGEFFSYVVEEPGNKVTQRKLILGRQVGTNIVIKEGLTPGEIIVVEGVQNLKEGVSVTTDTTNAAAKNAPLQKK